MAKPACQVRYRVSRPLLGWVLAMGVLAVNLFVAAVTLRSLRLGRQAIEDHVGADTANLALLADRSIAGRVEAIDLTLKTVTDEMERRLRAGSRPFAPEAAAFLATQQSRLFPSAVLHVTDASGRIRLGEGVAPDAPASLADRDYFQRLRSRPDLGMTVSDPVIGRLQPRWLVSFARRYNGPDGAFAGVATIILPVTFFDRLLAGLDVGPNGVALLRDAQGGLITHQPPSTSLYAQIGAKRYSSELARIMASGLPTATFHPLVTGDGVERIDAYRRLASVPFHLVVGRAAQDYLQGWEAETRNQAYRLGAFLLGTVLVAWLFWRLVLRHQAQLNEFNAELEGMVHQRTASLEEANREIEAFAYSVSHDLRGPLRAMDGFSSVLAQEYGERLDEEGRRYLSRIRAGTLRMGTLIDDLLRLSRITRSDLCPEDLDLSGRASAILLELARRDPGRAVRTRVSPGLEARGDARLVALALENLLGNAWKYTSKVPEAWIAFEAEDRGEERVFCVRDNGAGFDMQFADRLFSPFQRLHRPDEFEGNGIGLAIVQRVIRRHGGRIWAQGEPGSGAAFFFTLPSEKDGSA